MKSELDLTSSLPKTVSKGIPPSAEDRYRTIVPQSRVFRVLRPSYLRKPRIHCTLCSAELMHRAGRLTWVVRYRFVIMCHSNISILQEQVVTRGVIGTDFDFQDVRSKARSDADDKGDDQGSTCFWGRKAVTIPHHLLDTCRTPRRRMAKAATSRILMQRAGWYTLDDWIYINTNSTYWRTNGCATKEARLDDDTR